jgi:DMSO/TMAO reductase YedYZ molybdopterin-dependent catalytic subunit
MAHQQITRRNFLRAALQGRPESASIAEAQHVTEIRISPLVDADGYTPTAHFYRQQLGYIPQITPVFWALRLYGQVEKVLTFTHEELTALPTTEVSCTLACIGSSTRNPMIGHARWSGVPMQALLERVRPTANARFVQFYAADGYTTYLETEKLDNTLLAFQMNGAVLPQEHGYPARLIVPGLYGYKMPKWIQRIELTDTPKPGFWEERGWSATGDMQTTSAILTPHHLETVHDTIQLSGIAYAGDRSVAAIEISVNDAPWMPVSFTPAEPYRWTRWQIDWTPTVSSDHLIKVRATDSNGFTQSAATPTFPHGPSAIQNIIVRVTA